jgi:hypothetical protein
MRITGTVTTSRLKQVVIEAVGHTADQLETGGSNSIAGFASLDTVPAMEINGRARRFTAGAVRLQHRPRPADRNIPGCDTTGDAGKRAAALASQANDHWRDARWAISDIRGEVRNSAEAF